VTGRRARPEQLQESRLGELGDARQLVVPERLDVETMEAQGGAEHCERGEREPGGAVGPGWWRRGDGVGGSGARHGLINVAGAGKSIAAAARVSAVQPMPAALQAAQKEVIA
jgi:hypothetical protein